MTNVEKLLLDVRHVKAFLDAAEAALSANIGPDDSKIDAARIVIEEAEGAFRNLIAGLGGSKQAPSIADLERINRERGERDASATSAGRPVNM